MGVCGIVSTWSPLSIMSTFILIGGGIAMCYSGCLEPFISGNKNDDTKSG